MLHRQPVPPDVGMFLAAEADRSMLGRLLQLYVDGRSRFRETIVLGTTSTLCRRRPVMRLS